MAKSGAEDPNRNQAGKSQRHRDLMAASRPERRAVMASRRKV